MAVKGELVKGLNLRCLPAVLLAAAASLFACKAKNTYVHVRILPAAAVEPGPITDVELELDLAGKTTTVHLADPAHGPLQLPTDVTLQVKTGSGQLAITAIARDAAGEEVDRATGTVQVSSGAIAEAALQLPGGSQKTLTLDTTGGNGTGAVSCAVNGGAAGTCAATYRYGETVVLSATPDTSSNFTSWSVPACGTGPTCTVGPINGSTSVIAAFTLKTFTVTVVGADNGVGTVTGGSLSCSINASVASGTCVTTVDYGSNFNLGETPAPGSVLIGWSGGCVGSGSTCTIANVTSEIISPACRATIVAPKILSVPFLTCNLANPSVSPSTIARSTSLRGM